MKNAGGDSKCHQDNRQHLEDTNSIWRIEVSFPIKENSFRSRQALACHLISFNQIDVSCVLRFNRFSPWCSRHKDDCTLKMILF
jgi:hypothetical protein